MAAAVTDPRAGVLRQRYHELFADSLIPVPVERIAEDLLGLRIERDSELGDISGVLYPEKRHIVINANEGEARQRFTLAHELGHWVCQCLAGSTARRYCRHEDVAAAGADRAVEREANVFAAELLMAEPEVRAAFAEEDDVAQLAARFGVSPLAMRWRLYSFSLSERPEP